MKWLKCNLSKVKITSARRFQFRKWLHTHRFSNVRKIRFKMKFLTINADRSSSNIRVAETGNEKINTHSSRMVHEFTHVLRGYVPCWFHPDLFLVALEVGRSAFHLHKHTVRKSMTKLQMKKQNHQPWWSGVDIVMLFRLTRLVTRLVACPNLNT